MKDLWRLFRKACTAKVQPASHHHSCKRFWDQSSSGAGDLARNWDAKGTEEKKLTWIPTKEQSTKTKAVGNPSPRKTSCWHWGRCMVRPSCSGLESLHGWSLHNLPGKPVLLLHPPQGGKRFHSESPSFQFLSVVSGPSPHTVASSSGLLAVTWRAARCPKVPLTPSEPASLLQLSLQGSCSSPSAFGALWSMVCACAGGHQTGQCTGEV